MRNAPRPPATVRVVEEHEAKGKVREIFQDIKATKRIDFVPNFWKTLASYPPLLEQTWLRLKTAMTPGKLDALTKEMIALAVSATNGCEYCINSHTAAVKKLGLDDEGLGELMAVVATFNATNALADGYRITPDVVPPVDITLESPPGNTRAHARRGSGPRATRRARLSAR